MYYFHLSRSSSTVGLVLKERIRMLPQDRQRHTSSSSSSPSPPPLPPLPPLLVLPPAAGLVPLFTPRSCSALWVKFTSLLKLFDITNKVKVYQKTPEDYIIMELHLEIRQ